MFPKKNVIFIIIIYDSLKIQLLKRILVEVNLFYGQDKMYFGIMKTLRTNVDPMYFLFQFSLDVRIEYGNTSYRNNNSLQDVKIPLIFRFQRKCRLFFKLHKIENYYRYMWAKFKIYPYTVAINSPQNCKHTY